MIFVTFYRCAKVLLPAVLLITHALRVPGQESTPAGYQVPPREIQAALTAADLPAVIADSRGKRLLLVDYYNTYSIADLVQPELKLAGVAFNPENYGRNGEALIRQVTILDVESGRQTNLKNVPDGAYLSNVAWSPDDSKIAFCVRFKDHIQLWYADAATGAARPVKGLTINHVFNRPFQWLSDSRRILCRVVYKRDAPPVAATEPVRPVVQVNEGGRKPARTYQNMLRNAHDEQLFDHYAFSSVVIANVASGAQSRVATGIISYFSASPDGQYVLLESLHRPYSYAQPYPRFPKTVQVLAANGALVKALADVPLQETVAPARDAVSPFARSHDWRTDAPATLYWAEAQDGGDPGRTAAARDKLYTLAAPFAGDPTLLHTCTLRFESVWWGNDSTAIVNEKWWNDRRCLSFLVNPAKGPGVAKKLFDYSVMNRYETPGTPATRRNGYGAVVLNLTPDARLFLLGEGASPRGDIPFVNELDLASGQAQRVWQSQDPYFERPITVLGGDQRTLLISRESKRENPNYFACDLKTNAARQLTFFKNPYAELAQIEQKEIRFKRDDGLEISAVVYLPAGKRTPLPTLLWAYPAEYKNAKDAEQVVGSPNWFTYMPVLPPVALALQGYAVLLPVMPVIGEGNKHPNDTYLEQLVMNARAVVAEGARAGIIDTTRLAVGGHSYGAFMAANLVTHTNLFKAGIAMSGAYNRTLTPFGFQAEERTYWEARPVYEATSPFQQADQVKAPLLLVHGEADSNSGTFPWQSERYFQALKGLGATVRYVSLPHEGHTYKARESVYHVYWEMLNWLNRYLKNSD